MTGWIIKVRDSLIADREIVKYRSKDTEKDKFTNRCKRWKAYLLKITKAFWVEIINCFEGTKNFLRQIVKEYWNSLSFCKKFYLILLILLIVVLVYYGTPIVFSNESVTFSIGPIIFSAEQAMLSAEQVALFIKPFTVKILRGNKATALSAIAAILSTIIAAFALYLTIREAKYSRSANRDNRLAKAAEMMGENEPETSHRGGLYILRDLISESPETEYIRCVEVIAELLKGVVSPARISQIAIDIFGGKNIRNLSAETRNKIIKEYKEKNGMPLWPDFCGVCLSVLDLRGIDFQGADLRSAKLQLAKLGKVNLQKANLQFAILIEADLQEACLEEAELSMANLQNAKLQNAKLRKANLQSAEMTGAQMQEADLRSAALHLTKLQGASLEKADLHLAHMTGANLQATLLSGAKMEKAIGLKEDQIIEGWWRQYDDSPPPEFSENFKKHPKVKDWLDNPKP